jgi:hypothetical protein
VRTAGSAWRRTIGAAIARSARRATFTIASTLFTPPLAARAIAAFAVAGAPLASFARFASLFVAQFSVAIGVEFLEHPLAHFGPLGAAFSRRRGRLVALLCPGGASQHCRQQHRVNRNKASHRHSSPGKEWTRLCSSDARRLLGRLIHSTPRQPKGFAG